MSRPIVNYQRYSNLSELWWCNSHQRRATYVLIKKYDYQIWLPDGPRETIDHCCDPKLGGILLPCSCVNLTGIVEIEE